MTGETEVLPIYWDPSAILSVLFEDSHSVDAQHWAKRKGFHFTRLYHIPYTPQFPRW